MKELIREFFTATIFLAALYCGFVIVNDAKPAVEIKIPKPTDCKVKEKENIGKKTRSEKSLTPTAICRDGTFSYSNSRRGSCSWHKGVAKWLR